MRERHGHSAQAEVGKRVAERVHAAHDRYLVLQLRRAQGVRVSARHATPTSQRCPWFQLFKASHVVISWEGCCKLIVTAKQDVPRSGVGRTVRPAWAWTGSGWHVRSVV